MAKKDTKAVPVRKEKELPATTRASRPLSPAEGMENLFDEFFARGWLRPFRRDIPAWFELTRALEGRTPSVDVIDRDKDILVRAEVPGIDRDDLEVSICNNRLTIKGSTRHEKEEKEEGEYLRREMTRGSFSRTLTLPAEVDDGKASAKFTEGVLEMTLPKRKPSRQRRIRVR